MENKQPQAGPPQITPAIVKNAKLNKCECGGVMFEQKFISKKVSAILSPTGQEIDIPITVLVCTECGKIPAFSDPENLAPKSLRS